jgi:hypothetical protein
MDPFFMYVSIGALVLLIIILIIVGVVLTQMQSLDSFPPTQNACPDHWDVSSNPQYCGVPVVPTMRNRGHIKTTESSGIISSNAENIGMCDSGTKNFGCVNSGGKPYLDVQPYAGGNNKKKFQYVKLNNNTGWNTLYRGDKERCAQKKWAQTMDISWDGVTNYNGC